MWYNQRDGTFADIGQASGTADSSKTIGTAFGDYDGDGYLDLYVVNIGTPNRLYHNGTDGTFVDRADQAGVIFPLEGGYVTFFLDFNNDGQLDLFASTMSAFEDVLNSWVEGRAIEPNRPFLYLNNGDGTFADIAVPAGLGRSFGSMGIGLGDVDNNGFPDIYLANGGPEMYRLEPNALFLNQGDGRFVEVTATAGVGNLGKGHGATLPILTPMAIWICTPAWAATTTPTFGPIVSIATTDPSAIIWGCNWWVQLVIATLLGREP